MIGQARPAAANPALVMVLSAIGAAFLALAAAHSYLLFHGLAEVFSVAIAAGAFMIAWNSRDYPRTVGLVCLGTGLVFTALIDVFHTMAYNGMGVFAPGNDYATKLWIAGRYVQVLTYVLFSVSLGREREPDHRLVAAGFALISLSLIASIVVWDLFPTCFVEGQGVTAFKRLSEYAVCGLFAAAGVLLHRRRRALAPDVYRLLTASIVLTILSELSFTLYLRATGLFNMLGHFLKIGAFFLVYKALIAGHVRHRIAIIRDLEQARAALLCSQAELREANAAKDRLYSIVAHDMRNPIGGLKTLAELMFRRYDDLREDERRRYCKLLFDGAEQAAGLTESLLMWASSQAGRLASRPEDFALDELVAECAALASAGAAQKDIAISAGVPPGLSVHADREMCATVLRNLLSNAVKFTKRGGTIRVGAAAAGDEVRVSVADSGIGMTAEELEGLFDAKETRSTRGTEAEIGTALGLMLSRDLVRKNGGRIWAESEPGRGSTFAFTIPQAAPVSAQ